MRKYYTFFALLFLSAQAQFAFSQFKRGKAGWDLVSIQFALILGGTCLAVLVWIRGRLKKMDARDSAASST